MNLIPDIENLTAELEALAAFSDVSPPAVTRVVFTEADLKARKYVNSLCQAADLQIREDAVGNTFARWIGDDPDAPAIGTGSHIDAIPNAGMFDGTVGVLGGLEAIRTLQRAGFRPRRSIELVVFTSEEPTRFGIGCLGSRLLSGVLTPERAGQLRDSDGASLDDARATAGFVGSLATVKLSQGHYSAFVELHIEQGPILEKKGIAIGIVTDIAAPASAEMTVIGEGGHAGAVLMKKRRDALVAAAEIIRDVETVATCGRRKSSVATVGICDVFPGAVNSIPSRVKMSLDVRDTDLESRDATLAMINSLGGAMAKHRKVKFEFLLQNADAPAKASNRIVGTIKKACEEAEVRGLKMVSRAYHDSLFMAQICPMSMIFIPCRGGVSHRPDEYARPEDISLGVEVLARTLADLSAGKAKP